MGQYYLERAYSDINVVRKDCHWCGFYSFMAVDEIWAHWWKERLADKYDSFIFISKSRWKETARLQMSQHQTEMSVV